MFYVWFTYKADIQDTVIKAIVKVEPTGDKEGDVEVVFTEPPEFEKEELEGELYGSEHAALDNLEETKFNPHLQEHWSLLPYIYPLTGYGGVGEVSDENYVEFLKQYGVEISDEDLKALEESEDPEEGEETGETD